MGQAFIPHSFSLGWPQSRPFRRQVGIADHSLPGFQFGSNFLLQHHFGFFYFHPPDMAGIADLNIVIVDRDVNRAGGFSDHLDAIPTGVFKFRRRHTTTGGGAEEVVWTLCYDY